MKATRFARGCSLATALLVCEASAVRPPAEAYHARASADGVQRVSIVAGNYSFRPERIVVQAGQSLELTLTAEPGLVSHRFVLRAPDGQALADLRLGREARTLRFRLAEGDYPFHCSNRLPFLGSHRDRGMAGVLEVRE